MALPYNRAYRLLNPRAGVAGPRYGSATPRYANQYGVRTDIYNRLPQEDQQAIQTSYAQLHPTTSSTAPPDSGSGGGGDTGPTFSNVIPNAGTYLEQQRQALQAWQNAQAATTHQYQGILNQYGLMGNIANGDVSNVRIDPNSQYGLIQQMFHNQADQLDTLRNDSEQRNLGTVGLGAQAADDYRWQMGAQSHDLQSNFQGALAPVAQAYAQAQADYNNAIWQSERDAADSAVSSGNFNPADINSVKAQLKKLFGANYKGVL